MQNKTFIIAEAGVNHNGSISIAKKLIDAASNAGADAVKFQSFFADSLVSENAPKAAYQKETTNKNENQYQMLKKLELNEKAHVDLIKHCKRKKISFISSPFDIESINLLEKLGLTTIKIPSGEITNYPYLRALGKLNKKVLLSTGMSNNNEIMNALQTLMKFGTNKHKITLLQCNTQYPSPFKDANLNVIPYMKKKYGVSVGYSDHTPGIEASIAAVALGATVIEKHFTLNKNMKGPDHKASIEPEELKSLVKCIRNIEFALGNSGKIKCATDSEKINKNIVRKSIFASNNISKGEMFSESNITTKRPGTGLSPMLWGGIIGKKAKRYFIKGEMISL